MGIFKPQMKVMKSCCHGNFVIQTIVFSLITLQTLVELFEHIHFMVQILLSVQAIKIRLCKKHFPDCDAAISAVNKWMISVDFYEYHADSDSLLVKMQNRVL